MVTAINALKLAVWLGAGPGYFLGLGWLAAGPLLFGSLFSRKSSLPLLQLLPLTLLSGILINFGLQICLQSVRVSSTAGLVLSLFGLVCFGVSIFHGPRPEKSDRITIISWIGASFFCLIFLVAIIAEPLQEWDARSIWFFHAKMIYYAGSVGLSAGWQDPSLTFSHPDYPILVPALAAQIASAADFWNEYLPKISLFFLLVPAVFWLFSFTSRSFCFIILVLLIPFGFHSLIWNGFMDGYLALYFAIAMLLLGRFLHSRQAIDLISSTGCLIILLYIKNEGALAIIAGLSLVTIFGFNEFKPFLVKNLGMVNRKYILAIFLSFVPFILWSMLKKMGNISNDLQIGSSQSFINIFSRLADGSYKMVLRNAFLQIESALLLLGLAYFASVAWKKSIAKESLPALLAAGIYGAGILTIYLLTPRDVAWHLQSSIDRTLLPVNGCIFIATYFILKNIETEKTTPGSPADRPFIGKAI